MRASIARDGYFVKRALIALTVLVCLVPRIAIGESAGIQTVNLMPAFFSSQARTASLDERIARFKDRVLYPNGAVYNMGYVALDDPHIAWYLRSVSSKLPNIERTASLIERTLPADVSSFEAAFPKFKPQTVSVYLMPSMGSFDGMTKDVNGKHALLIGVDAFSSENLPVGIFMDHELFHIYHHAINPTFFVTSSENDLNQFGLYRQLWAEGLATYVSQKLNSGATDSQALASTDLANLSTEDSRKLACLVSDNLDSTESGYAALLFDVSEHPKGLPSRGGYYVGYLIARELSRTYSLSALAELNGDALHSAIANRVHQLCGK